LRPFASCAPGRTCWIHAPQIVSYVSHKEQLKTLDAAHTNGRPYIQHGSGTLQKRRNISNRATVSHIVGCPFVALRFSLHTQSQAITLWWFKLISSIVTDHERILRPVGSRSCQTFGRCYGGATRTRRDVAEDVNRQRQLGQTRGAHNPQHGR
jgi:hypothetical protein